MIQATIIELSEFQRSISMQGRLLDFDNNPSPSNLLTNNRSNFTHWIDLHLWPWYSTTCLCVLSVLGSKLPVTKMLSDGSRKLVRLLIIHFISLHCSSHCIFLCAYVTRVSYCMKIPVTLLQVRAWFGSRGWYRFHVSCWASYQVQSSKMYPSFTSNKPQFQYDSYKVCLWTTYHSIRGYFSRTTKIQ